MIRVDGDHWIKTVSTKQLSVTSNIFSPGGMGGGEVWRVRGILLC